MSLKINEELEYLEKTVKELGKMYKEKKNNMTDKEYELFANTFKVLGDGLKNLAFLMSCDHD